MEQTAIIMEQEAASIEPVKTYTVTELCREFGVTPRTLRFYEQRKLLKPGRSGEARAFTYRDRARLKLILRNKQFGFTLTEIKQVLDLYQSGGDNSRQLRVALPQLQNQLIRLERDRQEIDEAIETLKRTCEQVAQELGPLCNGAG